MWESFVFKDSWFGSLSELIVEKMSKITFKWFVYQLFCSQERLLNAIVLDWFRKISFSLNSSVKSF